MNAFSTVDGFAPPDSPDLKIGAGTQSFVRTNRAMFLGGFSTFSLLYCVQPLMPLFSKEFDLTPMQSSWTLSLPTAILAVVLLFASALSDSLGRKPLMCLTLSVSAAATFFCAFVRSYPQLLIMRGLLGVALAGLPATAMAYLNEEIEPQSLGYSVGLYIGGSAFGGMAARVTASVLSDDVSWRFAMGAIGFASMLAAIEFWRSLPPSKHFKPGKLHYRQVVLGLCSHLRDEGMPKLFGIAFLLMGCFVSMYDYIGYRLTAAPFSLSQSAIGALFSLYLAGIFSSVSSGKLADRFGRRHVLWIAVSIMLLGLLLTLGKTLAWILPGIALFTFGFFGGHAVASSWVARRAQRHQALASALYLFFYYLGASVVSTFSGVMWSSRGWTGMIAVLAAVLSLCLLLSIHMRTVRPVGGGR